MTTLAALGANRSLTNVENSTALMMAAGLATRSPGEDAGTEREVLEAVQVALSLGADVNAVDNNGETAVHAAAYKNLPRVVKFLVAKGARVDIWNRPNKFGWTPLAIAVGYRFGNFKPSADTEAAVREVMIAAGVTPPVKVVAKTQQKGLPIGTRGGAVVDYTFPMDGEYGIQIRLMRDRDEHIEGLTEPHDLELLLDKARVQLFTVKPPEREPEHASVDQHLKLRIPVHAGPHALGVTFIKKPSLLPETARQPYQARFNYYRHPRIQPAIYSISIVGPYGPGVTGDSPSRRRLGLARPAGLDDDDRYAKEILTTLMKRAYRRPVTPSDLQGPFALYKKGRAEGGFDAGIELALAGVLVSPQFLFRLEPDPAGIAPRTPYRVSDLELASDSPSFSGAASPMMSC